MDQSVAVVTGLGAAGVIGKTAIDRLFEKDGLVCKLVGPVVDELAQTLADGSRRFRVRRQLEGLQKTEQFLRDAKISPRAVNLKLLFPLLEFVAIEEDEDLHTKWAALLANAADPAQSEVSPGNVDVLRQLTSREARFLDGCFDAVHSSPMHVVNGDWIDVDLVPIGDEMPLVRIYADLGLTHFTADDLMNHSEPDSEERAQDWANFRIDHDSLLRHRVLVERVQAFSHPDRRFVPSTPQALPTQVNTHMTVFGYNFVKLCRAPKTHT